MQGEPFAVIIDALHVEIRNATARTWEELLKHAVSALATIQACVESDAPIETALNNAEARAREFTVILRELGPFAKPYDPLIEQAREMAQVAFDHLEDALEDARLNERGRKRLI